MDFEELVGSRRSVRGFRKDPVPKELLVEVIELATRAPSSMNTQPWYFHAITGAPLDSAESVVAGGVWPQVRDTIVLMVR